jgi:hypothetical protein
MSQGSTVTSRDLRKWAISSESDEVNVWLIEITHPTLSESIRVSSNPSQFLMLHEETKEPIYGTVSNGKTFYAIPFQFTLPTKPEDGDTPRATIRVDNVDKEMVEAIRNIDTFPMCNVYMIFDSSPDVIRETLPNFRLTGVTYTATSIEGTLSPRDFRAEPFPAVNFYPALFPGLF